MSPAENTSHTYGITALDAGLQVLRSIGEHPDQNVPQLAALTGLTKSKVFRIVRTLEAQGLVCLSADHTVRLGATSLVLGRQAERQVTLLRAAAPALDGLLQDTQENVYLMVREGTRSMVLDTRTSPHAVRVYARMGHVGPLYAGGAPKVLLAYAPAGVVRQVQDEPKKRFTSSTVQSPDDLNLQLARIRQDGYHLSISDLEEQVFATAVPVFGHQDQVVAAISLAGPLTRLDEARRDRYLRLLRQASQLTSRRLGA